MNTRSQTSLRIAIATGRYFRPGETFVARHIAELFGGNTVVIAGRRQQAAPEPRPTFFRGQEALNLPDLLCAPWHLWQNQRQYGTLRVPFGRQRKKLHAFLQQHGVQAILCEFGSQGIPMWPVGLAAGIPVFCYFRGKDATEALRQRRRVAAYQKMFPCLAGVFAVSRFLLDQLASMGIEHPCSRVVPSGVSMDMFRPLPKQPKSILAVGRFVEKKAPSITIKAFLDIAQKHPQARLEMIGHGPLLHQCKALVAKARCLDRVAFHGQKPHDFVRQRMGAAEVFIQHSVTARNGEAEGLPSSIQEAMACGAAIVSTRHAGIPAAVEDGVTGFLVDEFDREGFAAKLDRVLESQTLRQSMGRRARDHALVHFDYRSLYRIVEEEICEAVARSRSSRGQVRGMV